MPEVPESRLVRAARFAGSLLRHARQAGAAFAQATRGEPQRRPRRGTGELVMSSIAGGSSPYGWYSGWSDDRLELVAHYRAFVYMAVRKIAETVAGLPPFVGTVTQGKGPRTAAQHRLAHIRYVKSNQAIKPHEDVEHADSDHPLVRLFETPNAHDMAGDLWYELILFLELTGNAYLWCPPSRLGVMDGTGKPAELWVIPSHWIRPVMGNGRMPDYYLILPIVAGPGSLRIPPEEIIHFRYKSPIHKIDGFSALRAGDAIIDTYEAVNQARYWQMRNGCFPAGALSMEAAYQDPDEQEMERIGAKFAARYQGTWNTGRPVVLPPGMKYDPLVINPTEMAYLESADQMMTWVLALFGVPKEVLGLQPSGGDLSWYAPRKQFHSETIKPKLQYLGQTITRHLASRWGDDLRVWWPDSVPDSPEDIRETVTLGLTQGCMTRDEARAMLDLPELGGMAAELLVPQGLAPIDNVGQEPDMGGLGEGGIGGTESFFDAAPKDEETGRAITNGDQGQPAGGKTPSAGSFFAGPKSPTTGRQELHGEGESKPTKPTKAMPNGDGESLSEEEIAELGKAFIEELLAEWGETEKGSFFGECDRDEEGHCVSGSGQSSGGDAHSKASEWVGLAKRLPAKTWERAKAKAKEKYSKLEARYGRKLAIAILAAGIAGTATPLPGGGLVAAAPILAVAEMYVRLRPAKAFRKSLSLAELAERSAERVITADKDAPDEEVWEQIQSIMPAERPAELPHFCGHVAGAEVYLVDGDLVKTQHDMDFVEGGNDRELKDRGDGGSFIPENTLWVDAKLDPSDYPFVLYHEAHEWILMGDGMRYGTAHDHANAAERQLRMRARGKPLARLAARSRRQFALAFNGEAKAAESYFGNCPRDEEGHCKPSGQGDDSGGGTAVAEKPSKPAGKPGKKPAAKPGGKPAAGDEVAGEGASVGSDEERAASTKLARKKIKTTPAPDEKAVAKAREELAAARRGEGRAGGEARGGSAASRRQQRRNLFKEFGGEEKGYVVCPWTGLKMHWTDDPQENPQGYPKFERGKIFVKCQGGGYQLANLIPESFAANRSRNDKRLRKENSDGC